MVLKFNHLLKLCIKKRKKKEKKKEKEKKPTQED